MSVFNTQLTINSSGIHIYRESLKKTTEFENEFA